MTRIIIALLAFFAVLAPEPAQDGAGMSDIYKAIRNDDLPALQRKVASSATVDVTDDRGQTPLMKAAAIGSPKALKILLAAGANVNARDKVGLTPLMFGIRDISRVRLLLDAGAEVNVKSNQQQTPLLIAAANPGSIEIVRLLVSKGADPKVVGANGRTALIVAAEADDLAMVRFFVEQGIDVNATNRTNKSGHTALMAAAAQSNEENVKVLLKRGADPNMATSDAVVVRNGPLALKGQTPLMYAGGYGSSEIVRMLLKAGANTNARDVRGMTPLMFSVASEAQDTRVIKLLMSAGANVNSKDTYGETALDWARKYGSPAVLQVLNSDYVRQTTGASEPGAAAIPPPADIRPLLQTSVGLLQRSSTAFSTKGGCVSCHHQNLVGMAVAAARDSGIPVDEGIASEQRRAVSNGLLAQRNNVVERTDGSGALDHILFTLVQLEAEKYPGDETTDSMVAYLLSRQLSNGRWPREELLRSPLEEADLSRVAPAISALRAYAPPSLKAEADQHISLARQWAVDAQAKTTDDHAMRLIALQRAGGANAQVQAAAKALLRLQRPDGGWAANQYLDSDAYATGVTLSALYETGMLRVHDPAYERGVKFLLHTRENDGSWHVRSRAPKFQPYFESEFPHGHDQWMSLVGTARAVMILANYIR